MQVETRRDDHDCDKRAPTAVIEIANLGRSGNCTMRLHTTAIAVAAPSSLAMSSSSGDGTISQRGLYYSARTTPLPRLLQFGVGDEGSATALPSRTLLLLRERVPTPECIPALVLDGNKAPVQTVRV